MPAMVPYLDEHITFCTPRPYIDRTNVLRLWPLKHPKSDGRGNEWHVTARLAAATAQREWVRVVPKIKVLAGTKPSRARYHCQIRRGLR